MTATEELPTLGTYKGHDVTTATISIRNTGHGLEEAMEVDPVELELASTQYVVLECEVEKHRYDPIKDTDELQLVNMLKAGRATLVDRDLVAGALDEQSDRIRKAKAEAKAAAEHDKRQLRIVDPADDAEVDEDDPELAGAVAVEVLEEAERTGEWRRHRTAELDAKSKPELEDLARELGVPLRGRPTKSELVDAIIDEEEARA